MARLRNRILKADFWSDGELLRWPREKRMTYAGLFSLAEDSGCLEDDSFTWKCLLWPSPLDSDITLEMLEAWRDELCDAGKLVPYFVAGQQYLYLTSFHGHERPRNPQRPSVPLPEWITWVPHETNPHKGHYDVRQVAVKKSTGKAVAKVSSKAVARNNGKDDGSFDVFWSYYPRHEAKEKSKVAWKRVTKAERLLAIGVAEIMGALYANGVKEKQYIPMPTTFIHGKRWEDWREGVPAGWQDSSAERAAQQEATLDAAIEEYMKEEAWPPPSSASTRS